jgi:hypothetical protein
VSCLKRPDFGEQRTRERPRIRYMRTSENSVKAKFGECAMDELQAL